jgi:hypothetical protein
MYDYLIYRVTKLNSIFEANDPYIFSRGIISLAQAFNILSLIMLIFNFRINEVIMVSTILAVLFINQIFFINKKNWIRILLKYKEKTIKLKILKDILVVSYFLLSIIFSMYVFDRTFLN